MDERFRAILAQSILLKLMETNPEKTLTVKGRDDLREVAISQADKFLKELQETSNHGK